MFCIYLRTNSDLCHLQHKLIGFYNRDEKCLLRGTDWVFKKSSLRFVFKGLIKDGEKNAEMTEKKDRRKKREEQRKNQKREKWTQNKNYGEQGNRREQKLTQLEQWQVRPQDELTATRGAT